MTPVDPLNRPLPYLNMFPEELPDWLLTTGTVLMYVVGILAVFFTLIFIVAIFQPHDPLLQPYVHRYVHKAKATPKRRITLRDHR
jgi:hypothetical protein